MDNSNFLRNQLEKPSAESKKYQMSIIGLKGIAGMFIIGALMFVFLPALAAQIATLVQFGFTAWGGLVAVYLGGQSTTEWRTTAALEQTTKTENKTEDIHQTIEHVYPEGEPGSPPCKPFGQHASDEHS